MKNSLLLFFGVLLVSHSFATKVTNFTGTYRQGQVFFTWTNISTSNATYKLYRSSTKITKGSQLASAEYLGYTNQSSALNNNLTDHDGTSKYYIIQTGGSPLSSFQGLFITTSVANGSYYYALTTVASNVEDTAISVGTNSLNTAIAETVSTPQPVLQETRTIDSEPVEIYADFMSSRVTLNGPLRMKVGWLGYDFAVYRNNATAPQALHMRFHAGGNDFLNNITKVSDSEVNLGIEDNYPDGENSGWIGTNEAYDPYKKSANSAWSSGTNYFYSIDRINKELSWVIANCMVDSNRIYVDGVSFGSVGAFLFTLLHPERIAAANLTSGIFNFGFASDYNSDCTMNSGQKNRTDGDKKLGTIASNLPEGCGLSTYNLVNGGWMIHQYNTKDYPVIYSVNGRNDDLVGWTEKTIWYDSVDNNHLGGYYFYDERDHAGDGKAWLSSNFDMYRYSKNVSYPAFSNCSVNNDAGNGNGTNGDLVGTYNGYLDWKTSVTENASTWIVKIYTRPLEKESGIVAAPTSCTTTITPRRLQQFKPSAGTTLEWSVLHLNQQIQSGSFIYSGGLITIPGIQIYSDTITFQISIAANASTYYLDADGDDYGNPSVSIQASYPPSGYVNDHTDCNDSNADVHAAPASTVTPSGDITACKGTGIKFTASSGGSGCTYQWYRNNVAIADANKKTYTSSGNEGGSYKILETNSGGCSSYSAVSTITRLSKPKSNIVVTGNLNICSSGSVTLSEKHATGPLYQWNKNGVAVGGATHVTYVATAPGSYSVVVIDANGCDKESNSVIVTSCRDQEMVLSSSAAFSVQVSPNPAKDFVQLKIQLDEEEDGTLQVQLMNLVAQPVLSVNTLVNGTDFLQELSLKKIQSGMYFVKVILNDKSFIAPLIVSDH